jgi:thiol:disulfide interchange protein DsbC
MGVDGTPAVFTSEGDHIGGYVPPDQLIKRLDQLAQSGREVTQK